MENSSYEICDNCGSFKVHFYEGFGFYKCVACGAVWAYSEDDPDYYEMEDEINDKYAYSGGDITLDEATQRQ